DVSAVIRPPDAPTGIFFVERGYPGSGQSSSYYYRQGSAGSRFSSGGLRFDAGSASILHVSGISLAVSRDLAGATRAAMERTRDAGGRISFDVNFRSRLWSASDAR